MTAAKKSVTPPLDSEGPSEHTRKCWPAESFAEVVARVRAEHGDAVADLILRDAEKPPARKKRVPRRVGNKERVPMALSQGLVPKQGVAWNEGGLPFGSLPRSGAGPIPTRPVLRAHSRRRGSNDS